MRELELLDAHIVIESAFRPLMCRVEPPDDEEAVIFRIFQSDGAAVLRVTARAQRVRDPLGLRAIIAQTRARLEAKGHKLEDWEWAVARKDGI
jgi:hypothetical protein